jgi:hypothetical protein
MQSMLGKQLQVYDNCLSFYSEHLKKKIEENQTSIKEART